MKLCNRTFGSVAYGVLIGFLASASITFADEKAEEKEKEVKISLQKGEIAIVIPASGAYKKIEVYAAKSSKIIVDCKLCKDDVESCRKNKKDFCDGSIDVVLQNVLPLSVVDTQDKHSPNTCYRQLCWSGGCTTVSYRC